MKKRILSLLFIFCIACSAGLLFSACKKKITIKSSDLYYGETAIEESTTLKFDYGEDISSKINSFKIVVKFSNKTEKTYEYKDFDIKLSYTYSEITNELENLPTGIWETGLYSFEAKITPENFDTITKKFAIEVQKAERTENYVVKINNTTENCSWIYDDNLDSVGDPTITVADESSSFAGTIDYMYLTTNLFESYNALQTDAEKADFLQNNGLFFESSYRFYAGEYYMYAKLHSDKNHLDKFTPLTKFTVNKKNLDLSDANFSLEYTFSTDKNSPEQTYVTLEDISSHATMPEIDGLYGHFEWLEDNPTQFSYSKDTPTVILKAKFVLDRPSYNISPEIFDVPLTIKQGLIQVPVFKDSFDGFTYKGYAQGFDDVTAQSVFDSWFTADDLRFLNTTGLELYTDAGNYTTTFSIIGNNPNFAFTEDGETALNENLFTLNWEIKKVAQTYMINGQYPDNKCNATTAGIVYLPSVVDDGRGFFLEDNFELLIDNGAGDEFGTGTITGSDFDFLNVSKTGKFIIKIYSAGDKNHEAINDSFELNVEKFVPNTTSYQTNQSVSAGSNLTNVKLPGSSTTKGYGNWVWSLDGENQVTNYESVVFNETTTVYAMFVPTNPVVAESVKIQVTITAN